MLLMIATSGLTFSAMCQIESRRSRLGTDQNRFIRLTTAPTYVTTLNCEREGAQEDRHAGGDSEDGRDW